MDKDRKATLGECLKEAMGLPPGEPPGPDLPRDAPRGTITSDDAQDLPPHDDVGAGLKREEE